MAYNEDAYLEAMAKALDKEKVERGESDGEASFLGSVAEGASRAIFDTAPEMMARAGREAFGYGVPDPGEQREGIAGFLDRFIDEQEKDSKERWFTSEEGSKEKFIGNFTYGELEDAVAQVGNSLPGLAAVGAILATGGGAAPLAAAAALGTAPMYYSSKDRFIDDVITKAQEEGYKASPEKWDKIREVMQDDAKSFAMWEAAPELASNILTAGIGKLVAAPTASIAKAYPAMKSGLAKSLIRKGVKIPKAARIATAGTAQFGQELATESVTSVGQQPLLYEYGLSDKDTIGFVEAAKENFAPTLVMSIVTGGAGALVRNQDKVRRVYESQLKNFDKNFSEVQNNVDQVSDDQLSSLYYLSRGKFFSRLDEESLNQYEFLSSVIDNRGLRDKVDKPLDETTELVETDEQAALPAPEMPTPPEQIGYTPLTDVFTDTIDGEGANFLYQSNDSRVQETQMSPQEYLERASYDSGFDDFNIEDGTATEIVSGKKVQVVDPDRVREIAFAMRNGEKLPKPSINYLGGETTQDGYHRAMAANLLGMESIPVVTLGTPSPSMDRSNPVTRLDPNWLRDQFSQGTEIEKARFRAFLMSEIGKTPSEITQDDINQIGRNKIIAELADTQKPNPKAREALQAIRNEIGVSEELSLAQGRMQAQDTLPTVYRGTTGDVVDETPVRQQSELMKAEFREQQAQRKVEKSKEQERLQREQDIERLNRPDKKPKSEQMPTPPGTPLSTQLEIAEGRRRQSTLPVESPNEGVLVADRPVDNEKVRRQRRSQLPQEEIVDPQGQTTKEGRVETQAEKLKREFKERKAKKKKEGVTVEKATPVMAQLRAAEAGPKEIAKQKKVVRKKRSKAEVDYEFNLRKLRNPDLAMDEKFLKKLREQRDKVVQDSGLDKAVELESKAAEWRKSKATTPTKPESKVRRGSFEGKADITKATSDRPYVYGRDTKLDNFLESLPDAYFEGLTVELGLDQPGENTPQGEYKIKDDVIAIYNKALRQGRFDEAMVHEMWHKLARYLPDSDVQLVQKEFQKQKSKYLKDNPHVREFDNAMTIRGGKRLTGKDAKAFKKKYPNFESMPDIAVEKGGAIVLMNTPANYKFTSIDEFFSESMKDITFSANIEDPKTKTIVDKFKDLVYRVLDAIRNTVGFRNMDSILRDYQRGKFKEQVRDQLGTGDTFLDMYDELLDKTYTDPKDLKVKKASDGVALSKIELQEKQYDKDWILGTYLGRFFVRRYMTKFDPKYSYTTGMKSTFENVDEIYNDLNYDFRNMDEFDDELAESFFNKLGMLNSISISLGIIKEKDSKLKSFYDNELGGFNFNSEYLDEIPLGVNESYFIGDDFIDRYKPDFLFILDQESESINEIVEQLFGVQDEVLNAYSKNVVTGDLLDNDIAYLAERNDTGEFEPIEKTRERGWVDHLNLSIDEAKKQISELDEALNSNEVFASLVKDMTIPKMFSHLDEYVPVVREIVDFTKKFLEENDRVQSEQANKLYMDLYDDQVDQVFSDPEELKLKDPTKGVSIASDEGDEQPKRRTYRASSKFKPGHAPLSERYAEFGMKQMTIPEDQVDEGVTNRSIEEYIQGVMQTALKKMPKSTSGGYYSFHPGNVKAADGQVGTAIHEMMHRMDDKQKIGFRDKGGFYQRHANQLISLLTDEGKAAWRDSYSIPKNKPDVDSPELLAEGFAEFGKLYTYNPIQVRELLKVNREATKQDKGINEPDLYESIKQDFPELMKALDEISDMRASYAQNTNQNMRTMAELDDRDMSQIQSIQNYQMGLYDQFMSKVFDERQAIYTSFDETADKYEQLYRNKANNTTNRKEAKEFRRLAKMWSKGNEKGYRNLLRYQAASMYGIESQALRMVTDEGLIGYNGESVDGAISFTDLIRLSDAKDEKGRAQFLDDIANYLIARRVIHEVNKDNLGIISSAIRKDLDKLAEVDEELLPTNIVQQIAVDARAGNIELGNIDAIRDYLVDLYQKHADQFGEVELDKIATESTAQKLNDVILNQMDAQRVSGAGKDLMTDYKKAVQAVEKLENKKNVVVGARVIESWGKGLLKLAYDAGRISEQQYEAMKKSSEMRDENGRVIGSAYVSFMRVMEDMPGQADYETNFNNSIATDKSIAKTRRLFKNLTGSQRPIENVFISTMKNLTATLYEVENNELKRLYATLFNVKPSKQRSMYEDPMTDTGILGNEVDEPGPGRITVYYKDGPRYFEVSPEVYLAMQGSKAYAPQGAFKFMHKAAQLVRNAVTIWPSFLNRNAYRDSVMQTIVSRFTPNTPMGVAKSFAKTYGGGTRQLFSSLPGVNKLITEDPEYAGWIDKQKSSGADIAFESFISEGNYKKTLNNIMKSGLSNTHAWGTIEKFNDFARWYSKIRDQSERTARLAEFREAYKYAKDVLKFNERKARKYATAKSRSLLDFNRSGQWIRPLMYYIPFFNSAIQGMYVTYDKSGIRSIVESYLRDGKTPTKQQMADFGGFMTKLSLMTLPFTLLSKMANYASGTEDDLEREPAYVRYLFWNFPLPDEIREVTGFRWLSIPKPYDLGLFSAWVEYAFDAARGRDNDLSDLVKLSGATVTPDVATPLVKLGIGLSANYDSFRQRYIVPPHEAKLDLRLRKNRDRASTLAQALDMNMVDPRYIDFAIRELGGYPGRFAQDIVDWGSGRDDKKISLTGLTLNNFAPLLAGMSRYPTSFQQTKLKKLMDMAEKYGLTNESSYRGIMELAKKKYENITNPEEFDRLAEMIDKRATKLLKLYEKKGQAKLKREERKRK